MSDAVLQAVIQGHARQLRTPTIARECAAVARRARDEGWPYEEYLRELLEAGCRTRQDNAARRYLKQAGSPTSRRWNRSSGMPCKASRARSCWSWPVAAS